MTSRALGRLPETRSSRTVSGSIFDFADAPSLSVIEPAVEVGFSERIVTVRDAGAPADELARLPPSATRRSSGPARRFDPPARS
jgi:hypothetical protein